MALLRRSGGNHCAETSEVPPWVSEVAIPPATAPASVAGASRPELAPSTVTAANPRHCKTVSTADRTTAIRSPSPTVRSHADTGVSTIIAIELMFLAADPGEQFKPL